MFHIIVNTNIMPPTAGERAAGVQDITRITNELFLPDGLLKDKIERIEPILIFGPKTPAYRRDKADDVIRRITYPGVGSAKGELGSQFRIHSHVLLRINHYSQIQLRAYGPNSIESILRKRWNERYGPGSTMHQPNSFYVRVKLLQSPDHDPADYLAIGL